jgi:putative membrane protein
MQEEKKQGATTDHMANERTFLAWIRTGIGIMAFGFVVAKFSLFVTQISLLVGKEIIVHQRGYSAIMGIILVTVGALTSVLAYLRYKQTEKQLKAGKYEHTSILLTVLTVFIFLMSIFLILYLIQSTT